MAKSKKAKANARLKRKEGMFDELIHGKAEQPEQDEAMAEVEAPEVEAPSAKASKASEGMEVDRVVSKKALLKKGLELKKTSMKRGQRTKNQINRNAVKLAKGVAKNDRSTAKVSTGTGKRIKRLGLKHMY
eukprot:gene364-1754_t